jgi:putative redox-active protein with C_GCAxxG_C_C motif
MLSDIQLQLLQWSSKGYCCSQILVGMALEFSGIENPPLLRAAEGLCSGMSGCNGTCGLLTGGSLLLGLYAGHDAETEEKNEHLPLLLESFIDWFTQKNNRAVWRHFLWSNSWRNLRLPPAGHLKMWFPACGNILLY